MICVGCEVVCIKLCSHCRSDQLDRSNHPNSRPSLTDLNQSSFSDLFSTKFASVWSSKNQVLVE